MPFIDHYFRTEPAAASDLMAEDGWTLVELAGGLKDFSTADLGGDSTVSPTPPPMHPPALNASVNNIKMRNTAFSSL